MDPEARKSGDVTQMSDVYSYGVVLCEILCGRKAFLPDENEDNKFLAPLVRFHYENETIHEVDIIHPDIRNQINSECYEFAQLACDCTKEDRVERPDIIKILDDLSAIRYKKHALGLSYAEGLKVTPSNAVQQQQQQKSRPSNAWKIKKFKHLKIGLIDIKRATKNFSQEYAARSEHNYCKFYDTKLECFDREYNFSLEKKNKGKLPKKNYDVQIKCIIGNGTYTKHTFYEEIDIQGTCMHENLQPLLGFCNEGDHMIFVYEYPVDCNYLSTILNGGFLTWEIRLKICLDIARGLNYMHNEMEDQKMVIHGKISSGVIVWDAKRCRAIITEFNLSTFFPLVCFEDEIKFCGKNIERENYLLLDPEFGGTEVKPTKEIDIYCFGLVMFEILCGKTYKELWEKGSDDVAQRWLKEGIIKQKMARAIKEENFDNKKFLKKGPNEESWDTFKKITEQCLGKTQNKRPTLQVIIQELEKALLFQENHKDPLRMSFEDINLATQSFSGTNDIGGGGFGRAYKGELASEHGSSTIVAKRLDTRFGQGDQQFYNELHILSEYKHENVIGLVGYNNDEQERIIVYEYASKGSLDRYLNKASLNWINRLNICIDVARGLAFLHGGVREHEAVIHRDMKTANILLFDDWKAKVADYGLSLICTISDETDYVIDHVSGTRGYCDPVYQKSGFLTKESDIYSLGVVLFEILYGKSTYEVKKRENQFLHSLVKQRFEKGRLDEVVFNAIKNQIVPEALATFQAIAYRCLHDEREKRPTAQDVLVQLQKAMELQVKDVPVCKES